MPPLRLLRPGGILAWAFLWPTAWGFAHAEIGSLIEDREMPTLDGRKHPLLTDATVNVFIFFKPGQEHSRAVLQQMSIGRAHV